jgi:hypothetical protein
MQRTAGGPQSYELTRGPPVLVQHFRLGVVHIGTRALHVLNWIWFGCIARLYQWGGGGVISLFKLFLPAFATRVGREGGRHPVQGTGGPRPERLKQELGADEI